MERFFCELSRIAQIDVEGALREADREIVRPDI